MTKLESLRTSDQTNQNANKSERHPQIRLMSVCVTHHQKAAVSIMASLHSHTPQSKSVDVFSEVLKLKSLLASAEGHCMPNHCSWSAHCAASLSLPSRSPSSPLPSISSPSSSTVASVGLSSFSIFCMPSRDFWSFGSRLQKRNRTVTSAQLSGLRFYRTVWMTLP